MFFSGNADVRAICRKSAEGPRLIKVGLVLDNDRCALIEQGELFRLQTLENPPANPRERTTVLDEPGDDADAGQPRR